ncbi:hypothetical protein SNEBB_005065 [Seison nebaliae]|nr:hypothetical protein SNEBB_005065 [Seison nebaliae]
MNKNIQLTWPAPPFLYYRKYTRENVEKGKAPKPPKIPKKTYRSFGGEFKMWTKKDEEVKKEPQDVADKEEYLIRPLSLQPGISRLYDRNTFDPRKELKKILHSIVLKYLDLVNVLANGPRCLTNEKNEEETTKEEESSIEDVLNQKKHFDKDDAHLIEAMMKLRIEKFSCLPLCQFTGTIRQKILDELKWYFIHFHHIVNELRQHQAFNSLVLTSRINNKKHSEMYERFHHFLENLIKSTTQLARLAIRNSSEIEKRFADISQEKDVEIDQHINEDNFHDIINKDVEMKMEKNE